MQIVIVILALVVAGLFMLAAIRSLADDIRE